MFTGGKILSAIVPVQSLKNQDNPALVYINSLTSKNSQRVMSSTLNSIIRIMSDDDVKIEPDAYIQFPWQDLHYQHTQAIRARLKDSMPPSSANRHLSALRGVLKECWKLGFMTAEEYQRAVDLKTITGSSGLSGRDIPDQELRTILLSCYEDGKRGVRNLAAIAIIATCGLRRAELVQLDIADFDPESGDLEVKHGKGRKQRKVSVFNKARQALDAWLTIRGDDPGALFYSFHRGDKMNVGKRWGANDLYTFVSSKAKEFGLKHLTPHDFRRNFIGNALDAGIDPVLLTRITGHASVDMLKKYDRRPEKARRIAQKKIDLPI